MLTQFLELIFDLKPQLPEGFNIDLVFAGTPVLRVDDTNIQFAQEGAIRFRRNPMAVSALLPLLLPQHEFLYWLREKY